MAAYLIDPTHLLWLEKRAYRDVLTSTFVNRNTAAVYFGSCAVLWLLIFCHELRGRLPPGKIHWRSVPHWLLLQMPRPMVMSCSMLLVCLAAMLMTTSRAGVVISLMALVLAFVGFFYRDLPRRGGIAAALAIGGLIALLVLQILGGNVSGRFEVQGLSDEGRLETYRSTLRMIVDHPWFGTGLGTFVWSFPAYRSAHMSMWGVWDKAHNTPLELASDLGLPLACLIVLAWLIVLGVLIRGVLNPPPRSNRAGRGVCGGHYRPNPFAHRLFPPNPRLCYCCICSCRCRFGAVTFRSKAIGILRGLLKRLTPQNPA